MLHNELLKFIPKDMVDIVYTFLYDFTQEKSDVINELQIPTFICDGFKTNQYIEELHNGVQEGFLNDDDLNFSFGMDFEDLFIELNKRGLAPLKSNIILELSEDCCFSPNMTYIRIIKNGNLCVGDIVYVLKKIKYKSNCDHHFFELVHQRQDGIHEIFFGS
jgi:hypothetical protein